jgi:acetylornithine deacetylase/succinyl-diaminopimelate desuccinylase-like protein
MATDKVKDITATTRELFSSNLIQALLGFVEIPNLSRFFDQNWDTNGITEQACQYCIDWAHKLDVKGLTVALYHPPGRLTPFIFGVIEGTKASPKNVIAYGHIDKQPHLTDEWSEGLHPTKPVIKDGYMYGRGSNDDGYAFFSAVSFAKISQLCGIPHDRIVLFFETDEESASCDLEFYLDHFKAEIGKPDLFLCLDSGTPAYDRFATTVTLRGVLEGSVAVKVSKQGVHSGMYGGIIPDSFRILCMLLNRIQNDTTGQLVGIKFLNNQ